MASSRGRRDAVRCHARAALTLASLATYLLYELPTVLYELPTDPLSQAGKARVPGKGSSASNLSLQRQAAAQPNSSSELRSLDKMMR